MAQTRRGLIGVSDPIDRLALKPFCEEPPPDITLEQRLAIHEFLHSVLVAGYKLYQIVPPELAAPVLREKFAMMAAATPPREGSAH